MNESKKKINFEQLHKAAEDGDAEAQFQLGQYYWWYKMEYEQGTFWRQKAAEQGHAKAQYTLGVWYYNRLDYVQALYWLRRAVEQGLAEAQCMLGNCYKSGKGVDEDEEKALYWYQKAAEQGDAGAQRMLGNCYNSGEGVDKDEEKAVYWYQKAAERGDDLAQHILINCYCNGIGVKKSVSKAKELIEKYTKDNPEQTARMYREILNDKVQAFLWYLKAADDDKIPKHWEIEQFQLYGKGVDEYIDLVLTKYTEAANTDPEYAWRLGIIYYLGSWVIADKQKAIKWFEIAGLRDEGYYWKLGDLFNYGEGGDEYEYIENWEQNTVEAEKWYICAAERSWQYAAKLADKYLEEDELKDEEKACLWLKKAGEVLLVDEQWMKTSDAIVQRVLGDYYFSVEQNYEKAVKYYLLATQAENLSEYLMSGEEEYHLLLRKDYRLGLCYYHGWGVAQNYDLAAEWFVKATSYSCMEGCNGKYAELFPMLRTLAEKENNAAAQYGLGLTYERGNGVEANEKLAVEWYQKAAERGDLDAIYEMGMRYRCGEGVSEDYETALRLIYQAAEQGFIPAIELLEENGRDVSGYQRLYDGNARIRRVRLF